jgi:beta-glucosidase
VTEQHPAYLNTSLSAQERAKDLVSRMTLEEKIGQMVNNSPAIDRLHVPEHNWWNECLHGVGRMGIATVFPQAMGLASMFDEEMMLTVATAISDEARAKHHAHARRGDRGIYRGLTYWTPNINIFRDPRWGRGQETYGECPYLTGRMGVAFVKGLQGDDPTYLKVVATPKHYAVHSGPEEKRHEFDVTCTDKDLWETYLPAFRDTVVEAGAWSVMGAYNRTNGDPCCAHPYLMDQVLRGDWRFEGYYVSDCGAIQDFHQHHKITKNAPESAAMAVKGGCDLNCGTMYAYLKEVLNRDLLKEKEMDVCLVRLFKARVKLGVFDPEEQVPYSSIPYEIIDCSEHRQLSIEAAQKSLVLLKNDGGCLPLSKEINTLAVIGPNADSREVMYGNYNGTPSKAVTPLEGIRETVSPNTRVIYQPGSDLWSHEGVDFALGESTKLFTEAIMAAEQADTIVLCLGLSSKLEGEQGDASNADASGDRLHLGLPKVQVQLLEAMLKVGKPVVVVLMCGSSVAIQIDNPNLKAIVQQYYPGQEGGTALASALFGDYSPAGRLPVTVYKSVDQLPDFENYDMENRTYRYFRDEPLFPFGFGLSYTTFTYGNLTVDSKIEAGSDLQVSVEVANTGEVAGDEVVQVYLSHQDAPVRTPISQLVGFKRLSLEPAEKKTVTFTLTPRLLAYVAEDGRSICAPGKICLYAGGSQPDGLSQRLGAPVVQESSVEIVGSQVVLER